MFDRFTDRAKQALNFARQEAQRLNHEYLGTEHIALGVLQTEGVAVNVLRHIDCPEAKVRDEILRLVKPGPRPVAMGQLPFTPRAKRVLEFAMEEASSLGHNYIGSEHLLLGLIKEHEGIAARALSSLGANLEHVRAQVVEFLGAGADDDRDASPSKPAPSKTPASKTPALDAFTSDWTRRAREGHLAACVGRERELDDAFAVACMESSGNPVFVGESGSGKTALLRGVARRLADGGAPTRFAGVRLCVLDAALLVAGTKYRGQFEERVKAVLHEIKRGGDVLLGVEDVDTLRGMGVTCKEDSLDGVAVLKHALSDGSLRCVGTATPARWRALAEADPGFASRFQPIALAPSSSAATLAVVASARAGLEELHRVRYGDDALQAAARATPTARRAQPGLALNALDLAGARHAASATADSAHVAELSNAITRLTRSKDELVAAQSFEAASQARDQAQRLSQELEVARQVHRGAPTPVLSAREIEAALAFMARDGAAPAA